MTTVRRKEGERIEALIKRFNFGGTRSKVLHDAKQHRFHHTRGQKRRFEKYKNTRWVRKEAAKKEAARARREIR